MFISIWMFLQLECFESLDLIPQDPDLGPIEGPPLNGKVVSKTVYTNMPALTSCPCWTIC